MRVAIVGGGISGLTIGDELARSGHDVTVFERGRLGGLASGFEYPGCPNVYLEKFYHHIFTSDQDVIRLIDRHGLSDSLEWLPSASGLIAGGRAWPFSSPGDLLRFRPLGNLWQRLMMGWNLRYFTRTDNWQRLDEIPCREFFARRGNLAGYRNLWEPLLRQKFGEAPDQIPAAFLWGRIHPRAQSRNKNKESLGYLLGGFQHLFLRMADSIRRHGGRLHTGTRIHHVQPGSRPHVAFGNVVQAFDRVIWTAGPGRLANVLDNPPDELTQKLHSIRYMAATQLILALKRRQTDYYWLNNIDPDITFGGLIEHTNLVSPDHYRGQHLVYLVNYHAPDDPRFAGKTQQQLLDYHAASLGRIAPGFQRDDVLRVHCIRERYSSPLYDLGYAGRRPPYHGWLPGIDLCGMSQVYPEDRNMNHGVANALRYVKQHFAADVGQHTLDESLQEKAA